jgi:hypothetical protein
LVQSLSRKSAFYFVGPQLGHNNIAANAFQFNNHAIFDVGKITYSLHGSERFFSGRHLCIYSRTQHFMEPIRLIPCSQKHPIRPYPEPDDTRPYHSTLSPRSILILPTHLRLVFGVVSFLLAFLPIFYMHSSSPLFMLYILPILLLVVII